MLIVILSGVVVLYFYMRFPKLLSKNRRGLTTDTMPSQIAELDRELRGFALSLDDELAGVVLDAVQNTRIGGGIVHQLAGHDPNCRTLRARRSVEQFEGQTDEKTRRQVITRLTKKADLLFQMRQDIRLRSLLKIWLYVHVPFTFAVLTALVAHIIVVFYYW